MDLAQALNQLWHRRGWVALGAVVATLLALATAYDLSFAPPSARAKTLPIATATTSLLVDTRQSAVTDLAASLDPLADRAVVFSRLGISERVRRSIGRRVGVDESTISFSSPADGEQRPQNDRERRITSILEQDRDFQVQFVAERGLPSIRVRTQAPRFEDARRLAAVSADALADYVSRVQRLQGRPPERQVVLRPLATPTGGVVAKEINRQLMAFAFVASLIAWCLLVLIVDGVAANLRRIRAAEADGAAGDGPLYEPPTRA